MGFETVSGRNTMKVYQYPIYVGYIFILLRITSMPLVLTIDIMIEDLFNKITILNIQSNLLVLK